MRSLFPPRSPAWWVVSVCALAAVGMFMVFEAWDLDGSDLYRRLLHPPLPSQPMVDVAGILRHATLATPKAPGHAYTLSNWPQLAAKTSLPPAVTLIRLVIYPTHIGAHFGRRRVTLRTPPSNDEPFRPTFRAI